MRTPALLFHLASEPSPWPQSAFSRLFWLRIWPTLWQAAIGSLRNLFSCRHARLSISEGKCYCPDCGQGLVFQWVLLRCLQCRGRRDSLYFLRRVRPAQRYCLQCGEPDWRMDYLESPAYFQLHKARLLIREEENQNRA